MPEPAKAEHRVARKREFKVHHDFPEEDVETVVRDLRDEGFMGQLIVHFAQGGHINAIIAEDSAKL